MRIRPGWLPSLVIVHPTESRYVAMAQDGREFEYRWNSLHSVNRQVNTLSWHCDTHMCPQVGKKYSVRDPWGP
jgi:hypothetical protein